MTKEPILIFAALIFIAVNPIFTLANGGDQRIVESKYMINLSRAPFTPRVGDRTSILASFVDLKTNNLVAEDLIVRVSISRLGGEGSTKRTFVYDQGNFRVKGGVLELPHVFSDLGLHEIFFDFAFASSPEKIFKAPDFLLDIQNPETTQKPNSFWLLSGLMGIVLGFMIGWFARRQML